MCVLTYFSNLFCKLINTQFEAVGCTFSLNNCLSIHLPLNRALIEVYNIKPITTSPHLLGVKRTAGFVRACSEMARHQDLVQRAAQTNFEKSTGLRSDSEEKEEDNKEEDRNIEHEHNGSKVSAHSKFSL